MIIDGLSLVSKRVSGNLGKIGFSEKEINQLELKRVVAFLYPKRMCDSSVKHKLHF